LLASSSPPSPPSGKELIQYLKAHLQAERGRREAAETEVVNLQNLVQALRGQSEAATSSHEAIVNRLEHRNANQSHYVAALREHGKRMETLLRAERARKRARTAKLPRDASAASTVDELPSPWREDVKAMQQRCRVLKSLLLGAELIAPDDQRVQGIVSESDVEDSYETDGIGTHGQTQEAATPDDDFDSPTSAALTSFYALEIDQSPSSPEEGTPQREEARPIEFSPVTDALPELDGLD